MERKSTKEILEKYSRKLESSISSSEDKNFSKEYEKFKEEMGHELSRYEKWANSLGNLISIKASEKDRIKIQGFLNTAHVDVTPPQAITLSIISALLVFFLTLLVSIALFFLTNTFSLLFLFLGMIAAAFVFYYAYTAPQRLANEWRLKASSQMVPAILYVVVYMKHTSNLERAIAFAADRLEGALALDFKKIFYDVEIGKFSTIKQSLDNYLSSWRYYSPEFIESFNLIESSLFEPSESRRVQILEKALQVILDGVYEKMLKYSREIRSPLTNVYMLGIILPTLGLALLPLASTLLGGLITWYHVFVIFNIIIPFFVFYLTSQVLLKRPGGYGESSVLELSPEYYKFKSKSVWTKAFLISFPFLIIGLLPFIFQINFLTNTLGIQQDYTFGDLGLPYFQETKLFDFKIATSSTVGPFGPLAVLLSLFIPFSIALFFSYSYKQKTLSLIKSREDTKKLEEEFTNSIFQLGNRLGDGMPAEVAFGKVAESTQGLNTSNFFALVNQNIQQLGMSLDSALFDKKRGAIIYFPSPLIATSMKILVESVKKGLQVAARSLMSISEYVKNIQRINQRLRDLVAEIVSDMKSNMTFLAPILAGVVIGLSGMITLILNKLQTITELNPDADISGLGNLGSIVNIFNVKEMIPPYFLQISIGIYIIEIIFILTSALVTVDSGQDKLKEKYDLYKNLRSGILLYLITSLISILALSILASVALGGLTT